MPNPRGNVANLKHLSPGPAHPRWNDGRMISTDGYVKIRVGKGHPLADGNGYAYEHLVVWVSAGRPKPAPGYLLHHKDEVKSNNQLSNLEMLDKFAHGIGHASPLSDRDVRGIRWRYAVTDHDTETLGMRYAIPAQTAWKIITGKTRVEAGGPVQTGSLRGKKHAGRTLDGIRHAARP